MMSNSEVFIGGNATGLTSKNSTAMPAEHRRNRRHKVLKAAFVAGHGGWIKVACVVRDQSEDGARLIFDYGQVIPRKFALHIEIDGIEVQCERIWRSGLTWGVRFIGKKQPSKSVRRQSLTCC
jgi:hypothetical protein